MFDDLIDANRAYASSFGLGGLVPAARKHLGVVTCIDSRIEPLQMLGLAPGDAKILRNAGARVTDDVLRSLALAVHLLDVRRVCVVQHTGCALRGATNDALRGALAHRGAVVADDVDFLPIDDGDAVLRADLARIRTSPLLPADLAVAGFVYDVATGLLGPPVS